MGNDGRTGSHMEMNRNEEAYRTRANCRGSYLLFTRWLAAGRDALLPVFSAQSVWVVGGLDTPSRQVKQVLAGASLQRAL